MEPSSDFKYERWDNGKEKNNCFPYKLPISLVWIDVVVIEAESFWNQRMKMPNTCYTK